MSGTSEPRTPGPKTADAKSPDTRSKDVRTQDARTPGAMIADARRKRGLSADDLAERTKIPVTLLVALEADEYHRLSGPLYARSFLRSCAKELGLPVDDVLDLYSRHSGETVRAPGELPHVPDAVRIRRVGLPWAKLTVGFMAVAGLAVLSFVLTRPGDEEPGRQAADVAPPVVAAAAERATGGDALPPLESNGTATGASDTPPAGLPGLGFADGMTWPVVVRLQLAGPALVRARRDRDEFYADVAFPEGGALRPVPAGAIVAGRAYTTANGLVVYWGAVERLSLVLGAAEGMELTVNGKPRSVELPLDGSDLILDLEAAASPLP